VRLTLEIWRQADTASAGEMHTYDVDDVSEDMSFLEMLDVLNERLNAEGEEPVAFDSDCREGICGMCGLMINGEARKVRVGNDEERADLERQLRREARAVFSRRIKVRADEMGVTPTSLQVRDQKSRWGSASKDGALSLSWRLILCPAEILDYLVVHELAHLRYGGHGKRFWQLVERHYGDHRAARKWLDEHNDEIRQALD